MSNSFDAMFKAKSIAVYGASNNPVKVGGRPLRYLLEQNYTGEIYPINPNYEEVQGRKCYHTVEDLPYGVDLVIIAVPASATLEALKKCISRGIKAAVVLTAGFSEVGAEGKAMQEEMVRLAKESGMRILGPNCLGMMNIREKIPATFATVLDNKDILSGPISLLSQSGAFGAHILGMAQKLKVGFNYWVTTGNEADIQVNDCIAYAAQDENTSVIAGYIEDARDGEKLLRALDICLEKEKPVVLMKVGRTQSGTKAAMSHTGALAGNYQVYEAVFKQKGVVQATDLSELIDYASILTQKKKISGNRVAIITISGGAGVMMADKCEEYGLALAEFSPETEAKLKKVLPVFASVRNPVDVTAQAVADPGLFGEAVDICLKDAGADVLVIYLGLLKGNGYALAQKLAQIAEQAEKPVIVTWVAGPEEAIAELKSRNVMVFEEPIRGIKAVGKLVGYHLFLQKRRMSCESGFAAESGKADEMKARLKDIAKTRKTLSEHESRKVLQAFGIPVVEGALAYNADEAAAAAERLGYPVVLKVNSHEVPHKSDAGGVILNLTDAQEVKSAYAKIMDNVKKALGEEIKIDGILVQKMVGKQVETLIGMKTDPLFGPAIAFGLGGIFVEVFKDVSLRAAPISREDARSMLTDIRGKKILDGTRGSRKADQDAIVDVLMKVSQLAVELKEEIAELDINPLFVGEDGAGVLAGDALIALR